MVIKPDVIIDDQWLAPPHRHHVGGAIVRDTHGPAKLARADGGGGGVLVAARELGPEPAPRPAHLHAEAVLGQGQHLTIWFELVWFVGWRKEWMGWVIVRRRTDSCIYRLI